MNNQSTFTLTSENLAFAEELSVLKPFPLGRYQVYSTISTKSNKRYALKVFPHIQGEASTDYLNEVKYLSFNHKNIISALHAEKDTRIQLLNNSRGSYILTELAEFGDFHEILLVKKTVFDEKLARFFFRQLIDGLEYLHSQGVYHLDIKPSNLLLNEKMDLKIIDFELAHTSSDAKIKSLGSKSYRAPELIVSNCQDPAAADIFSAAIAVFSMIAQSNVPFPENAVYNGMNLLDLLLINKKKFWEIHSRKASFSEEFKEMFDWMTKRRVEDRATIKDIKSSSWYRGDVCSKEEAILMMKRDF